LSFNGCELRHKGDPGALLASGSPWLDKGREVEALLVRTSLDAQASATLPLLLPEVLLMHDLVPSGLLKDLANRCRVQIDLGQELPTGYREVTLTGTVAGNAAVSFWLQLGAACCDGKLGASFTT